MKNAELAKIIDGGKPPSMDVFFNLKHCRKTVMVEFLQNLFEIANDETKILCRKYFQEAEFSVK